MIADKRRAQINEAVKKFRITTKTRMIAAMGGCCQVCGYDKCDRALSFHHLNPAEKDYNFGDLRANPKKWSLIVNELRKTVLLCNNCHMEVHAGMTVIPETVRRFDESYLEYIIP